MKKTIDRGALLALLGVSASMVAGCGPSTDGNWRVCTDGYGRRVSDIDCTNGHFGGGGAFGYGGGWRYFSRQYSAPPLGEVVMGGTSNALAGPVYSAPAEGISRSGFGSFGRFGGGG